MSDYTKPTKWQNPAVKLFPHQVGLTCPPHDFDAAPSDLLRIAPESVGVHGWMLHVPDYAHRLDQRKKNFGMLEDFLECMANNGADVCGQVGSNWVHASELGVEGIREHCERLSDRYQTPFHMAGYAMVEALRDQNIEKVALNACYHRASWYEGTVGSCGKRVSTSSGRAISSTRAGSPASRRSTTASGVSMKSCCGSPLTSLPSRRPRSMPI